MLNVRGGGMPTFLSLISFNMYVHTFISTSHSQRNPRGVRIFSRFLLPPGLEHSRVLLPWGLFTLRSFYPGGVCIFPIFKGFSQWQDFYLRIFLRLYMRDVIERLLSRLLFKIYVVIRFIMVILNRNCIYSSYFWILNKKKIRIRLFYYIITILFITESWALTLSQMTYV